MKVMESENFLNKEACEFLCDKGYSFDEIKRVIGSYSFFQYDYSKIDTMIRRSYDYFLDRDFTNSEIKRMALRSYGVLGTSNRKKEKIDNCLLKLGISKNEIKKMVVVCPVLYSYSEEKIIAMIEYLESIGYSREVSIFIIKKNPNIYCISISVLDKFVNDLLSLGFKKKDILRIGKNYPAFFNKSIMKVKEIINTLMGIEIGFSKEEAVSIVVGASSVLGYEVDTLKERFNDLLGLGFSASSLIKMIKELPTLIVSDIERTRLIVDFFTSINLRDKIEEFPKSIFMQSVETSYSRYCFYLDMGIVIDESNFKKLFYGSSFYLKNYGITKEDLLSKYNYDKDVLKKIKK